MRQSPLRNGGGGGGETPSPRPRIQQNTPPHHHFHSTVFTYLLLSADSTGTELARTMQGTDKCKNNNAFCVQTDISIALGFAGTQLWQDINRLFFSFIEFSLRTSEHANTNYMWSRSGFQFQEGISAMASNGQTTKSPPSPSPLRNSKFFQANMRILVTGGAGFIGSHLVDRLMQNEKNEVIVVDNYFTGSKDNLKQWIGHPRFELIRHDVTEPLLVEVDQIYHLACPASPIFYKYNPVKTIKTNVMGTLNMLGLAKRVGARILLTSTSEVYGDPLVHPQEESYWGNVNPIGVRSCYDEGKRVAETLMFDYHRQHGIEIRIARIFNTYGPRMNIDDGRVVSNFIAQAIRGESLTVQLPGTQTRSFCYVSDMVDGLIRLMEGDNTGPINIGNPGEFTMVELAETVKELINPDVKIISVENTPDDPRQRKPDITKATELLGWEPKVKLRDGVPLMEEDFRQRLAVPKKV
ncbi:hypothetical protein RHMOL_Rhmol09G0223200 [Rhododendron molle]|uniref:Uncharacterized protein n=1 Tax=Rhododendron molle TaxID=49168 RepID=A0ACC0MH84_RHOML|nr:hypothetical protein RHMOL_Rhmol09G0223200 [Rhododendron molle]